MDKYTFSSTCQFSEVQQEQGGDNNIVKFNVVASMANTETSHQIVFKKGAFQFAIDELKKTRKKGYLPMLYQHDTSSVIGGFPVDTISEDNGKLTMTANLNRAVPRGDEVYQLIKQGVLTDMSVGVMIDPQRMKAKKRKDDDEPQFYTVDQVDELYETSIVLAGSNPKAKIAEKLQKKNNNNIETQSKMWYKNKMRTLLLTEAVIAELG